MSVSECGGGSVRFCKGLQPSFSGNHGNRTPRSTGRKQKVGCKEELWGVGLVSVSSDKQ